MQFHAAPEKPGRILRVALIQLGVLLLVVPLHSLLSAYACSSASSRTSVGPGEPCTRTEECVGTAMCIGGVCREADAGMLVAECESMATSFERNCVGSEPRPCLWAAYRSLCRTGNTQLLVDSMRCLDATTCRTFSDPNEAETCLDTVHASATGQSAATRTEIRDACIACGETECDTVRGTAEIFPYLSAADLASFSACRAGDCPTEALIRTCSAPPGIAPFAACIR